MTLTRITSDGITDAAIVNADINASAAIAGTKISPDFGSQNITTTGRVTIASHTHFNFGSNNDNYITQGSSGNTYFRTASTTFLQINNSGHLLPYADSTFDLGTSSNRFRNFYADTLYGDGSNLTGINTDLVSDTSPQLGGNLDTNTKNIFFGDSSSSSNNRLQFGVTDKDLQLYHDGSNSYISEAGTGNLIIGTGGSQVHIHNTINNEPLAKFISNGAVELYYDDAKTLSTFVNALHLFGNANECNIDLKLSSGVRCGFLGFTNSGRVQINGAAGGNAYETYLEGNLNGSTKLFFDNSVRIETLTEGAKVKRHSGGSTTLFIEGAEGSNAILDMFADDGDDIADRFRLTATSGGTFYMQNYANNGWQSNISFTGAGNVELYHNGTKKLETTSTGVTFNGTGAILVPKGTTAQRPTGANGHVRYNETTNALEGYINGAWVTVKATGLAEDGNYANNTQATADDLWAYWDCDSTSTTRAGGDSGAATLYGVTSQGGKISNSWDRGTSATNGVLLTSMPTGNNFTLMFQLYRTDSTIHSSSDGAGIIWLDGALSGGSEGSVILGYDGSSGVDLRFGGNGWVSDGETVIGNFSNSNWYHMVITRSSGTTWKFYLDGSLMTTRTETMAVGSSWMLGNYSRVDGNGNTNNHYFRGRFDEIAVWDRTLTAAEISSIYTAQDAGTALI